MITKWCVILSDLEEEHFGLVGRFDTKEEVLEFANTLTAGKVNVAPFIPNFGWIGHLRSKEAINTLLSKSVPVK
jgi:hypothetical protein